VPGGQNTEGGPTKARNRLCFQAHNGEAGTLPNERKKKKRYRFGRSAAKREKERKKKRRKIGGNKEGEASTAYPGVWKEIHTEKKKKKTQLISPTRPRGEKRKGDPKKRDGRLLITPSPHLLTCHWGKKGRKERGREHQKKEGTASSSLDGHLKIGRKGGKNFIGRKKKKDPRKFRRARVDFPPRRREGGQGGSWEKLAPGVPMPRKRGNALKRKERAAQSTAFSSVTTGRGKREGRHQGRKFGRPYAFPSP